MYRYVPTSWVVIFPPSFLSRVLDVLVYIHLRNVCPSHHTSYVYPWAHLHLYMLSMNCCKRKCFYSHLLLLYILLQDAQLPILMACCAADVFCRVLMACSSLQAPKEKLNPVTRVCRCQYFMTAYDSPWRWTLFLALKKSVLIGVDYLNPQTGKNMWKFSGKIRSKWVLKLQIERHLQNIYFSIAVEIYCEHQNQEKTVPDK